MEGRLAPDGSVFDLSQKNLETTKSMKKAGEVRDEEKLPFDEDFSYVSDADLQKQYVINLVEDIDVVEKHYFINLVDDNIAKSTSEVEEAKVVSDEEDDDVSDKDDDVSDKDGDVSDKDDDVSYKDDDVSDKDDDVSYKDDDVSDEAEKDNQQSSQIEEAKDTFDEDQTDDYLALDEAIAISYEGENEVEIATLASAIKSEGTNDAEEDAFDVDQYASFDHPSAALDEIRAISNDDVEESDWPAADANTGTPPNADDMILELDESSWAKRCMDEFDLRAFPKEWEAPFLVNKMSLSDDPAWRSYYEARVQLEEDSKEVIYDGDDQKEDDTYNTVYEIKIQAELSKGQGDLLQPHTAIRVTGVRMEDELLESARVVSTIFSPYMLPRAVQFCHRYHRRLESELTHFYCTWYIQFISLADEREDDSLNLWRPCIDDLEVLCSNCYMTMPTEEVPWRAVEDIHTRNLSPPVVRRIREWMFGTPRSTEVMTDLELLKYAFASCGTSNFCTIYGTNGYRWRAKRAQVKEMLAYGISEEEVKEAQFVGINWLEHHCRLISGDLRPIDQYCVAYDQRYHKGKWGKDVIENRYELLGTFEETTYEENPWMVWDRSSHRIEGEDSMGYQMMSFIGRL
jgi:hypothetical protein